MNRTLVIAALAVVAVGAASFLLGRETAPATGGALAPDVSRDVGADRPAAPSIADQAQTPARLVRPLVPQAATGNAAAPAPVAVLPPHDVPLASIRADLEQRARAGDRRAACRLAVDLMRCQELPTMRSMSNNMERSLARDEGQGDERGVGFRIDFLARTQNRLETLEPLCEGISEADTVQGFDWLLRAAELGHTPSMAEFARRPAVPFQSYLSELDRLRMYRERAPEMAMRALAAGDTSLLPDLASAHLSTSGRWGFSPLGQLVEKDDATAYAYYTLIQRLTPPDATPPAPTPPQEGRGRGGRRGGGRDGNWMPRLMEGVSAEDRAAGEALATEWESRCFADRKEAPQLEGGGFDRRPEPALCDRD